MTTVNKSDIVVMRRYFPKEEYRLLKNRKSARMCRASRKEEALESRDKIKELQRENLRLKQHVFKLEAELNFEAKKR